MSTTPLMEIFKFNQEDLTYNRRSEFSPRQLAEEKTNAQGCRRSASIFIIITLLVIALSIATGWEWLLALAVPMGIFSLIGLGAIILSFSKSSLKVAAAHGTAKLTMNQNRGASYHVLIVDGKLFRIPYAAYNRLEEGATYAVYYIPMQSNQILSIEQVE